MSKEKYELRDFKSEAIQLPLPLQRQQYIDRTLDIAGDLYRQWFGEDKVAFIRAYFIAKHILCLLCSSKQSEDAWIGDGF